MAVFDDGTPLDAAALQDLDRRLTEVKSSIPKVGTTAINYNSLNQTITTKQVFGGTDKITGLVNGQLKPFSIKWPGDGAESSPSAVVITPMRTGGAKASITIYLESWDTSGCSGNVYLAKGDPNITTLPISYIVICS